MNKDIRYLKRSDWIRFIERNESITGPYETEEIVVFTSYIYAPDGKISGWNVANRGYPVEVKDIVKVIEVRSRQ